VVPEVITQNAGSPSWRRTGASVVAGIAFQAPSSRSRQISLVFGEEAATAPAATPANSASTTTAAGRTIERICASSAALARLEIATAIAPAAIAPRWRAMRSGVSSISMPTRSLGRTPASRKPAANWLTRATNAP
jgi:hypothetical protein